MGRGFQVRDMDVPRRKPSQQARRGAGRELQEGGARRSESMEFDSQTVQVWSIMQAETP